MSRRGLSLAEAVIAIFMLLSCFVVMTRLFMTGLRYETLVNNEQTAVFLAEAQLEEIRGWSAQTHAPGSATPFSNWTSCPGAPGPISKAAFPGYNIAVNTTVYELYSPCSTWELQYTNPAERRRLSQSSRRVRVTVSWSDRTFELESLVATPVAPAAAAVSVQVTPNGLTSIAQGSTGNFNATAIGPSGALNDVLWVWYIYGVGDGTLLPERGGATAQLGHYLLDAATPPVITGYGVGPCTMRALGRIRGKEAFGDSGTVDLP